MKFTNKDKIHYIIYRELDKMKIDRPYLRATIIVNSLAQLKKSKKNK